MAEAVTLFERKGSAGRDKPHAPTQHFSRSPPPPGRNLRAPGAAALTGMKALNRTRSPREAGLGTPS